MHTILLVDDDPDVRTCIGDMLKRSGYQVLTAQDGLSAIDALQRNSSIDLVITDRRMPGMDGLSLARSPGQG